MLQDAYSTDGYISVAYQLGYCHPLGQQLSYVKDDIVTGLEAKYSQQQAMRIPPGMQSTKNAKLVTPSTSTKYPALTQYSQRAEMGTTPKGISSDDDLDFVEALNQFSDDSDAKEAPITGAFLQLFVEK